jgi:hypothetical protein
VKRGNKGQFKKLECKYKKPQQGVVKIVFHNILVIPHHIEYQNVHKSIYLRIMASYRE